MKELKGNTLHQVSGGNEAKLFGVGLVVGVSLILDLAFLGGMFYCTRHYAAKLGYIVTKNYRDPWQ